MILRRMKMQIRWLGHSCFLLQTKKEAWLTDPFAPSVGYPIPEVSPTVVSMSHDHYDHADESWLEPSVTRVKDGAAWGGKDLTLRAVSTFHDRKGGLERGGNYIYIGESPTLRVAHLGDLGHLPTAEQSEQIDRVDILLLPVGGTYTIGPDDAWQVVELLAPKVVIPMHYQTEHLTFSLASLEEFLQGKPSSWQVETKNLWEPEVDLAGERIVVLKYS
jgi:L-ascorbate metabolism protein UlaG (beta-lactamase superfamily)